MRVHVDQPEKVEAQWRRQATQEHANEEQRVVIRLVIWRNEVDVEELFKICFNFF